MKRFRFLSVMLALCVCLSFAVPTASADEVVYQTVPYTQTASLTIGQPITITGVANYGAYTSNDSTTLLAIDTKDGTWFAAIGPYSADAFKTTVGSCSATLYGVYAGVMDINGMPIIDIQQGTMSFNGWVENDEGPRFGSNVSYDGSSPALLSDGQKVVDEKAAEKAAAEAAAEAAAQPAWKKTGYMVWIPTRGGQCYHSNPYCSGMIDPEKVDLGYAEYLGFRNCKRC